jgi:hypothetical protein
MNHEKTGKPFIPRDKPKSWVIAVLSVLIGLGGGLMGFSGAAMKIMPLYYLGTSIFLICWIVGFPSILFFIFRNFSGCYKKLEVKNWKEQMW